MPEGFAQDPFLSVGLCGFDVGCGFFLGKKVSEPPGCPAHLPFRSRLV